MVFILASRFYTYKKDEAGNRIPIALEDLNLILTNIKKHLSKRDNLLIIANDPGNYERNDETMFVIKESFKLTGLHFKNCNVLDNRTIKDSPKLVLEADFIAISGGSIFNAKEFYDKINLAKLLANKQDGIVSGTSAGAMFLTKNIFNFPERLEEIALPKQVEGLGFADIIYIPHFDGENKVYQIDCPEIDVVKDWVLPYSKNKKMYGFPDGSYALLNNNKLTLYGDVFEIYNGEIKKLNQKS